MVDQKKLLISIGATLVVLLLIVGITLAIVLPGRNSDSVPEPEIIPVLLSSKKLVIDHDGGADDAFAITMAMIYEKYFDGPNVVALTTTFGNVHSSQALFNSDRILTLMDRRDIPLYDGSRRPLIRGIESDNYFGNDGLGDTGYRPPSVYINGTPTATALIELSNKYQENLTIVAIGPLTNIALAMRTDPYFLSRIGQLYVGAGHIHSVLHPDPEFNAAMDPEAYHIVANSSRVDKITFVPFSQVYDTLSIPIDWRVNTLGALNTSTMEALNSFEQLSLPKEPAWTQLDPATMAIALNGTELVDEYRNTTNGIMLEGDNRGLNTNDFNGWWPTARMVQTANIQRYMKFLMDVYSAELDNEQ